MTALLAAALDSIRARTGTRRPRIGMVMGSGLGAVTDAIGDALRIPYGEIAAFPKSGVAGHAGQLILGSLAGQSVAALSDRVHSYEGHKLPAFRLPLRVLRGLGCEAVILVSTCGSLDPKNKPGRLVLVTDHINLSGFNPLTGPNDESVGPRFPPMNDAYDPILRKLAQGTARRLKLKLGQGVMAHHPGPSFETPAEIRAQRRAGGDMVGMSMVPETIIARHCGLRVLGIGAITNMGAGMSRNPPSHEDTLKGAAAVLGDLKRLVPAIVKEWR